MKKCPLSLHLLILGTLYTTVLTPHMWEKLDPEVWKTEEKKCLILSGFVKKKLFNLKRTRSAIEVPFRLNKKVFLVIRFPFVTRKISITFSLYQLFDSLHYHIMQPKFERIRTKAVQVKKAIILFKDEPSENSRQNEWQCCKGTWSAQIRRDRH